MLTVQSFPTTSLGLPVCITTWVINVWLLADRYSQWRHKTENWRSWWTARWSLMNALLSDLISQKIQSHRHWRTVDDFSLKGSKPIPESTNKPLVANRSLRKSASPISSCILNPHWSLSYGILACDILSRYQLQTFHRKRHSIVSSVKQAVMNSFGVKTFKPRTQFLDPQVSQIFWQL